MNSCTISEDLGWGGINPRFTRHRGFGEVLRTMKSVFGKEGKLLGLSIEMLTVVFFRVLDT